MEQKITRYEVVYHPDTKEGQAKWVVFKFNWSGYQMEVINPSGNCEIDYYTNNRLNKFLQGVK